MTEKPKQSPAAPVVLSTNCIVDGRFIPAGEPVPYASEADLPPNLKGLVATGDEAFYSHAERLIYGQGQPGPEPGSAVIFQQTGGGSQWRQARQVNAGLEQQAWAEAEAEAAGKLPPETEEVLQAQHDLRIGKALAQAKVNQAAADAVYENAAQAAEPLQLFVKRGGEMGRVERSKLKPGEAVFAKFGEGAGWQVVGHVDASGQAPEPPLTP